MTDTHNPNRSPLMAKRSRQTRLDLIDEIDGHLAQLLALLVSIQADGLENFNTLATEHQDNLLWLAVRLTQEARAAIDQLPLATSAK
tara:strand:- start:28641 stop:28901 length:261 start_codon:yes stop_codon:yes gene_type:complete